MKKSLLLSGLLLAAAGVSAQSIQTTPAGYIKSLHPLSFTPSFLGYDGPIIYCVSGEEVSGKELFTIYDETFNEKETLEFQESSYFRGTLLKKLVDGNWQTVFEPSQIFSGSASTCYYDLANDDYTGSDNWFYISQALFNDDNKYEVIIPTVEQIEEKTESDTDNDGIIDYIEIIYSYKYNGFQIVNNEGKVIQKIEYPETHTYGDDFEIWQTGDHCYLIANTHDEYRYPTPYSYTYYIYEIMPESSSLRKVNEIRSEMRINPSATKAGNIINIELGEDSKYSDIRIIDMSGRAVASMDVDGRSVVPFNTALLSSGVYVVMASDGKTQKETSKIIIR